MVYKTSENLKTVQEQTIKSNSKGLSEEQMHSKSYVELQEAGVVFQDTEYKAC